jgi:hypothetical protein
MPTYMYVHVCVCAVCVSVDNNNTSVCLLLPAFQEHAWGRARGYVHVA